jgi:hypothetical protein
MPSTSTFQNIITINIDKNHLIPSLSMEFSIPIRPSDSLLSTCSVARRLLLESLNRIDDLPARFKSIIGRELAQHTRWTANTARTHHMAMPPTFDITPLPDDYASCFHEVRLDIPTSCISIGMLNQLTSEQCELRSAGHPALLPSLAC